ncbi:MAG: 1-acyl-sn-glycerol-3-phosphate acyltransferase [Clostridia bacterium]|nr:1-acyl-sn-glycerol-3-phosphate acyltransferase [Clostridia bacterium]
MSLLIAATYIVKPLVRLCVNPKVTGKENFPQNTDSPIILCANHISNWDPLVVATIYPRDWRFISKSSLFKIPVVGWFMRKIKAIPVDRNSADIIPLRNAISAMKEGQPVVIFPQGRRVMGEAPSPDQAIKGAALMIASTNAVVVPVGIYTKGYKSGLFRRFYVNIGEPITSDVYRPILDEGDKATRFERLTEHVFSRICELVKENEQNK